MEYTVRELHPEEFPSQLIEIPQPPKKLWLAGKLPAPETVLLTVVGARKHTSYGKEACESIIEGLRGYDIAIISGLALGIDAVAHEAAMRAELKTIAVPGSGLNRNIIYPRSNLQLAERIVASGGALLSEFDPTMKAETWTFPQRNRIMAGLAQATLLIEAEQKSGTLITARLAADYNRDVFAVPGSIFSSLSKGTNQFIALGATPVSSSEDILRALGFNIDQDEKKEVEINLSLFPDDERGVLELLREPIAREALIDQLGLRASDANVLLMRLEIAGHIIDTPEGIRRT